MRPDSSPNSTTRPLLRKVFPIRVDKFCCGGFVRWLFAIGWHLGPYRAHRCRVMNSRAGEVRYDPGLPQAGCF